MDHILRSRHIQASFLDTRQEVLATKGCSKGGVLSPLLCSLIVDMRLTAVNPYHIQANADDIVLVVQRKFHRYHERVTHEFLQMRHLYILIHSYARYKSELGRS